MDWTRGLVYQYGPISGLSSGPMQNCTTTISHPFHPESVIGSLAGQTLTRGGESGQIPIRLFYLAAGYLKKVGVNIIGMCSEKMTRLQVNSNKGNHAPHSLLSNCNTPSNVHEFDRTLNRIAGYFRGVLIFVIFVTSPGVTKFCTHEVFHLRYKLLVLLLR